MGLFELTSPEKALRARQIAEEGGVQALTAHVWRVKRVKKEGFARVTRHGHEFHCAACGGGPSGKEPCVHILAVLFIVYDVLHTKPLDTEWKGNQERDWAAENQAEKDMPRLFFEYSKQLADLLPETIRAGPGRPATSDHDLLLACLQWTRSRSMRGTEATLLEANWTAALHRNVSFTQISKFLARPSTPAVLDRLLMVSAIPAAHLETECTFDGTWWKTNRLSDTPQRRLGREIPQCPPRLAVPLILHRTNLVPVVAVPTPPSEAPWIPAMMERCKPYFNLQRAIGDAGHESKEFHLYAQANGITCTIPAKAGSNISLGDAPEAKAWDASLLYRLAYPGRSWQNYKKHNNSEALHSSMYRRFDKTLRSHLPATQISEIYLWYLAHNLERLIKLQAAGLVTPDFRAAEHQITRTGWQSLDDLYGVFNGANRIQNILNLAATANATGDPIG